jgi:protease-4
MEPLPRKHPVRPDSRLIVSTGLVLLLAFIGLVLLFFVFSAFTPSLVGKCVAVVDINSELTVDGAPPSLLSAGYLGSEDLATIIDGLNKRDDVGAVLFVVNSPGGSVVATREVYEAVKGLNKPKVAYFREVAASGAYYVSSGTDYIVSDPDAITGSIGVIATFTDLSGLLDKVGVNVTAIKSGAHKDIGSEFRNMTPEEQQILQGLISEVYDEFRSVVIENRKGKLDMAKFNEISDGRILSGRQAHAVGLVDQLGNKKDAIMKAAELAGMDAKSAEDVKLCPISTAPTETSLLGLEGILRSLQLRPDTPSISYK